MYTANGSIFTEEIMETHHTRSIIVIIIFSFCIAIIILIFGLTLYRRIIINRRQCNIFPHHINPIYNNLPDNNSINTTPELIPLNKLQLSIASDTDSPHSDTTQPTISSINYSSQTSHTHSDSHHTDSSHTDSQHTNPSHTSDTQSDSHTSDSHHTPIAANPLPLITPLTSTPINHIEPLRRSERICKPVTLYDNSFL